MCSSSFAFKCSFASDSSLATCVLHYTKMIVRCYCEYCHLTYVNLTPASALCAKLANSRRNCISCIYVFTQCGKCIILGSFHRDALFLIYFHCHTPIGKSDRAAPLTKAILGECPKCKCIEVRHPEKVAATNSLPLLSAVLNSKQSGQYKLYYQICVSLRFP